MKPNQANAGKGTATDLESRLGDDGQGALKLWLRLLSVTNLIETEVRSRLRLEFGITLPRFDLMAQLERHPGGLRMGELSKRMMVTGGNVTGITDLLEQEGMVQREPVPDDRRAFLVKLTPGGRLAFRNMASRHEAWIRELTGALDEHEKAALYELLSIMKRGIAAPMPP